MVRNTIGRLKATQSPAEFCDVVALEARSITGLDLVVEDSDEDADTLTEAAGADAHHVKKVRYEDCLLTLAMIVDHWLKGAALPGERRRPGPPGSPP